jgi:outer membrane protein
MKNLILTLSVIALASSASFAQKIASADVNFILSVMPENEKLNEDLKIYATGLSKMVEDKKAQLDQLVKQFEQVLASGDTAKAVEIQKQGLELDKELQQTNAQAERQLAQKHNELLQPVLERIRVAMGKVATAKGFEYVMNSVDGSGTSVVLWGPEGSDITRAVVEELGIKLEGAAPQQEAAPVDGGKKKKK